MRAIPTYSDLTDELENYHDEGKNEIVNREARLAATKLRAWVENGMYAQLLTGRRRSTCPRRGSTSILSNSRTIRSWRLR